MIRTTTRWGSSRRSHGGGKMMGGPACSKAWGEGGGGGVQPTGSLETKQYTLFSHKPSHPGGRCAGYFREIFAASRRTRQHKHITTGQTRLWNQPEPTQSHGLYREYMTNRPRDRLASPQTTSMHRNHLGHSLEFPHLPRVEFRLHRCEAGHSPGDGGGPLSLGHLKAPGRARDGVVAGLYRLSVHWGGRRRGDSVFGGVSHVFACLTSA